MAALIRHALLSSSQKSPLLRPDFITASAAVFNCRRGYAAKANKCKKVPSKTIRTLESTQRSLAARGYLRPQKSYVPDSDTLERLNNICSIQGFDSADATLIDERVARFKLLEACSKEFKHDIPNSLLHTVETIGDLRQFYLTPVDATVPLEAMMRKDLPPNLHIQYEYHRFHPDTDTMFNGKSAFPKSSTLVTGLKYKKKYPGYNAKMSWP